MGKSIAEVRLVDSLDREPIRCSSESNLYWLCTHGIQETRRICRIESGLGQTRQ